MGNVLKSKCKHTSINAYRMEAVYYDKAKKKTVSLMELHATVSKDAFQEYSDEKSIEVSGICRRCGEIRAMIVKLKDIEYEKQFHICRRVDQTKEGLTFFK